MEPQLNYTKSQDYPLPHPWLRLSQAGQSLASLLSLHKERLVLAESCTGGLVAATLAAVPGISNYFCGSAVTYRGATKIQWLEIDVADVERDSAVNDAVAKQMAERVLQRTSEATIAASITGHLGPDAPTELDGIVFIGIATSRFTTIVSKHHLRNESRRDRQIDAATLVLESVAQVLAS